MTYTHICADFLAGYLAPCERPPCGGRSHPIFPCGKALRDSPGGVTNCRTVCTYTRRAEIISPIDDSRLKATGQPPDDPRRQRIDDARRRIGGGLGNSTAGLRIVLAARTPNGPHRPRRSQRDACGAQSARRLCPRRNAVSKREPRHASVVPKRSDTADESAACRPGRHAAIGTWRSRRTTSNRARRLQPDSRSTTSHPEISSRVSPGPRVPAIGDHRLRVRRCVTQPPGNPQPWCRYRIVAGYRHLH